MMQNTSSEPLFRTHDADVSVIRREFVHLTGNHFCAVILNQLLYWTLRVKDFDLLLEEERYFEPDCNVLPRCGWIYKTAEELNEETMLGISHPTMRKYLIQLIDQGWIDERAHPTERWNRTTQYRVNVRKVQEDLSKRGLSLPAVYLQAFASSLQKAGATRHTPKTAEIPNVRNLHSSERILQSNENSDEPPTTDPQFSAETPNVRNLHSSVKNLHSNERNLHSNVKNLHSYTYTENTTETINKDHTQRACEIAQNSSTNPMERDEGVCESFEVLEKNPQSQPSHPQPVTQRPSLPIPEAMVRLWRKHVCQEVLEPNKRRSHLLEAALQIHFQRDLRRWEAFCEHVKTVPFLMGKGPNGWHISMDWLLREGNLLKVLERNFDPSEMREQKQVQVATTERELDVRRILDSIKDPVWKKWCSQLAEGVRYNELSMLHKPLSVGDLQLIANARFLECEDERLVWVGSPDQMVLNRIEDLRLDISWVFAKEFPKARAFRTRLISPYFPPSPEGEQYA